MGVFNTVVIYQISRLYVLYYKNKYSKLSNTYWCAWCGIYQYNRYL